MKIYTKSGDGGYSSVLGDARIAKSDPIFEILGTLDELNACLGFAQHSRLKVKGIANQIQQDLFSLGALMASGEVPVVSVEKLETRVTWLEETIDSLDEKVPKLQNFILPGGAEVACQLHLARAVARRLERALVEYYTSNKLEKSVVVLTYINRLSDLLFVMARYANFKLGVKEEIWKSTLQN